jgi:hypothetical protein
MKRLAALGTGACAVLLVLAIIFSAAVANSSGSDAPSDTATSEIPAFLLRVYIDAARTCPGLPWEVLAAIGWTESRHADGHADPTTGDVRPPIVGPALDGTNGNQAIPDPTEPDGWAHAHGNMQFLKTTWAAWGRVAPGRPTGATPDYDNAFDSIYTAAAYLCDGQPRLDDVRAALTRYSGSSAYADVALAKATEYRSTTASVGGTGGAVVAGTYTLPIDRSIFDAHPDYLTNPHHDFPADDIPVPQGTPVYAVTTGTIITVTAVSSDCGNGVVLGGDDGYQYVYCHGSQLFITSGQHVTVGQTIMLSGTTGNSTGPHLHFQLQTTSGQTMCPQPLLVAWYHGISAAPPTTSSGCFY